MKICTGEVELFPSSIWSLLDQCSKRADTVASSPGHSHVFNVTRRKGGEPGTRSHVSDVAPGTDLMSQRSAGLW
jgi:hypothetical protein